MQPQGGLDLTSSGILTFTQADLIAKRVFYSFRLRPYSPMSDSFLFNVSTPHLTDGPFKCQVHHSSRRRPAGVTLRPLWVTEGSYEYITTTSLSIRINENIKSSTQLSYNVTSPPSHGIIGISADTKRLNLLGLPHSSLDYFTSEDLETGKLFYHHDGTESPKDRIPFVAWSLPSNFIFEGQLDINIKGINNHPPRRVPAASLSVQMVLGGSRRLTRQMLEFTDDDWDSDPSLLKYSSVMMGPGRGASGGGGGASFIGNLYDRTVSLSRPVFSWTQGDIDGGKLVFTHEGPESQGFLSFWVSDSKFTVNGKRK